MTEDIRLATRGVNAAGRDTLRGDVYSSPPGRESRPTGALSSAKETLSALRDQAIGPILTIVICCRVVSDMNKVVQITM